jgi:hypothetical protein
MWPTIVAALLPLDLRALIQRLPMLLARLAAMDTPGQGRASNDRSKPRQVDEFRSRFFSQIQAAA